jgi:hypothetical protein
MWAREGGEGCFSIWKIYYKAGIAVYIDQNTGYCRYEVGGGRKNKKRRKMLKRIHSVIQKHNVLF